MKKKIFSTFMAVIIAVTAVPGITAGAATKKISSLSISKISNQSYTGKALKPSVKIKDGSKTLKSGRDYTLSYSKNKSIGKASVKIKGKGNYSGTKTITFKIVPEKVNISSISKDKQKITLDWDKVSGSVTGYKVYYSESKSGDYTLLKTVKGASTTSYTTKKLASGTTYYFRVKAYKTVSGTDYTGANSAVKSKKTSGAKTTADDTPTTGTPASNVKVGEFITFGKSNWRVLEIKDDKALLLYDTENLNKIRGKMYNNEYTDVTWETCSLRAYLNGEYYNSFGKDVKTLIVKTKISNKDNPWYGTPGGKETDDYIFLLSIEEVVKYFGDSGQLSSRPGYASSVDDKYNQARMASYSGWLRSPGYKSDFAATVGYYGLIGVGGSRVYSTIGVLPAMWIHLTGDMASGIPGRPGFPATPKVGQKFTDSDATQWIWNGSEWVTVGVG